jgi:uncharacterized protein (DUF305 family)
MAGRRPSERAREVSGVAGCVRRRAPRNSIITRTRAQITEHTAAAGADADVLLLELMITHSQGALT